MTEKIAQDESTPGRPWRRLLLLVLLVGAGLRIAASLGPGLPYSFYGDEERNVKQALRFAALKTLDPKWYNKPTLGYYVLLVEYGVAYGVGRASGHFTGPEDFALLFYGDPGLFYLIGRLNNALFGLLTLIVLHRLGRLLFDAPTAVIGTFLLAICTAHVASSSEVKMDVPSAFFIVASACALVQVMRRGERRDFLMAGLWAGLGMATKYYAIVLFLPFVFTVMVARHGASGGGPGRALRRAPLGIAGFLGAFFVGAPYCFLNPHFVNSFLLPHLRFTLRQIGLGAWASKLSFGSVFLQTRGAGVDHERGFGFSDSLEASLGTLTSGEGVGWGVTLLAVAGIAVALTRLDRGKAFLLLCVTSTLLAVAAFNPQYAEPRHLNPAYPFLVLLAAHGIRTALRALPGRARPAAAVAVVLALLVPLPGMPGAGLERLLRERLGGEPRTEALAWIERTLPARSAILNDHERLPLSASEATYTWLDARTAFIEREGLGREGWQGSYVVELKFKRKAAQRSSRRRFHVISLLHNWQTEVLYKRRHAYSYYNPLPARSFWGGIWDELADADHVMRLRVQAGERPEEDLEASVMRSAEAVRAAYRARLTPAERALPPVELWTRRTSVSAPYLPEGVEGVRYVVTAMESFENYDTEMKRANFPDYSEFYDDLRAHYDAHQFGRPGRHLPAQVVRVYDLSRRTDAPELIQH